MRFERVDDWKCGACGFELWTPVVSLRCSTLALYNDARFPGRSILALDDHQEDFSSLAMGTVQTFIYDLQDAMQVLRGVSKQDRINLAILGNTEPHIHAHLIPRNPEQEPLPHKSPWDDTRPKEKLPPWVLEHLKDQICERFVSEF